MQYVIDVAIGVLSGVLTTAVLTWLSNAFTPWYENRLYHGVLLEGKWNADRTRSRQIKDKEEVLDQLEMYLELEQHGYSIKGIFRAKVTDHRQTPGETYENLYKVRGQMHDNYLILEYHPLSRKRTGLGSFVLEVKEGEKKLYGSISFVEEGEMEITALSDIHFHRESD